MSDLAPFVAAAMRDKVVLELMEENEAMRKQVTTQGHQFKAVEITGPDGDPVYARAQFDEDGGYHDDPDLWLVIFPEGKQLLPIALSMLEDIQIRLGGASKASFNHDCAVFETYLDEDARDHEDGKVVSFYFAGASPMWLEVMVDGWPRERWQATFDEQPDSEELLGHLVQTVASEAPTGKMVTFLNVSFAVCAVRGVIESLGIVR
jgi:hypothetical protein